MDHPGGTQEAVGDTQEALVCTSIYIYIYPDYNKQHTLVDPEGRCHKGGPGLWRPLQMPLTLNRRGPMRASNPSQGLCVCCLIKSALFTYIHACIHDVSHTQCL